MEWTEEEENLLKKAVKENQTRKGRISWVVIALKHKVLGDRGLPALKSKWNEIQAIPVLKPAPRRRPRKQAKPHRFSPAKSVKPYPKAVDLSANSNNLSEELCVPDSSSSDSSYKPIVRNWRLASLKGSPLSKPATSSSPPKQYTSQFGIELFEGVADRESSSNETIVHESPTQFKERSPPEHEHERSDNKSPPEHEEPSSEEPAGTENTGSTIVRDSLLGSESEDSSGSIIVRGSLSGSEMLGHEERAVTENAISMKSTEEALYNTAALDESRKLQLKNRVESMTSKTGIYSQLVKDLSVDLESGPMSYLSMVGDEEFANFADFDFVDDESDHLFAPVSGKKYVDKPICDEKLQEEIQHLAERIVDGVYVRVYENRLGLFRAAIVGAEGTPYQDGLFFFDVKLPLGYGGFSSSLEPNVRYHWYLSGAESINPNIHKYGEVVLSSMKRDQFGIMQKKYLWDPNELDISNLLSSIKGKLLNEDPLHCARPHRDRSAIEQQKSVVYSEIVIVRSLETMINTMKKPPKHFETFVIGHFRRRASAILDACNSYVQGSLLDRSKPEPMCTSHFRNNVIDLRERLRASFSSIGVIEGSERRLMSKKEPIIHGAEMIEQCFIVDLQDPLIAVDRIFWVKLLSRDLPEVDKPGWLEDFHMRAWINCLRRSRLPHDSSWTIMGVNFFNAFNWDSLLTEEADGSKFGCPAWWTVEKVLFPINIAGAHWILAKLDLETWELSTFDSGGGFVDESVFVHFIAKLPLFLEKICYFKELRCEPNVNLHISPVTTVPQQGNDKDCGVFTCMFMYQLINGQHIGIQKSALDAAQEFRQYMADELYKHVMPSFSDSRATIRQDQLDKKPYEPPVTPFWIPDLLDPLLQTCEDFWEHLLGLDRSGENAWLSWSIILAWCNFVRRTRNPDSNCSIIRGDLHNQFDLKDATYGDGSRDLFPAWSKVERLFFPIYEGKHWMLGELNLGSWKILLYDSKLGTASADKILDKFETSLTGYLDSIGYWTEREARKDKLERVILEVPQQRNIEDCGVYVCCFLYLICIGRGIEETTSVIIDFRQFMADQLCQNIIVDVAKKKKTEGIKA